VRLEVGDCRLHRLGRLEDERQLHLPDPKGRPLLSCRRAARR
jgi:hypothetical protein